MAEKKLAITPSENYARPEEFYTEPIASRFWNINIPPEKHTAECPEYLQYAFRDHKDRRVLSTLDADYVRQSWEEVKQFVRDGRLDLFKRVPTELRVYREYCQGLKGRYGSIERYMLQERLKWEGLTGVNVSWEDGFSNPDNYKILFNDFPYGIDPRIVHLIIWTKFPLPQESTPVVQAFIDKTFVSKCGPENVIWFINPGSLKSVHSVEHVHAMLFDPDRDFVRQVTDGDVPMQEKLIEKNP